MGEVVVEGEVEGEEEGEEVEEVARFNFTYPVECLITT